MAIVSRWQVPRAHTLSGHGVGIRQWSWAAGITSK